MPLKADPLTNTGQRRQREEALLRSRIGFIWRARLSIARWLERHTRTSN